MKIICHGDSLTEGSDIERAYTWSAILEHNLRLPVLNNGIGDQRQIFFSFNDN
jgi:hypothetical protein